MRRNESLLTICKRELLQMQTAHIHIECEQSEHISNSRLPEYIEFRL